LNILVVDDSSTMRKIVIRTLRQAGFTGHNIIQAEDGQVALDLILDDEPDLILSDWNMPNMTGIELLDALREENIGVCFGFVTTESTTEMRHQASRSGAAFLIEKPFTPESFARELSPVIS